VVVSGIIVLVGILVLGTGTSAQSAVIGWVFIVVGALFGLVNFLLLRRGG
jgi:hypothetical protein